MQAVLSKVCGETYPKTEPILWLNMRQEPSLYINGEPVCARPPNKVRSDLSSFQINIIDIRSGSMPSWGT